MDNPFAIFSAVVTAIFLEALPFLAAGSLLSAVIEVFVPTDRLIRRLPKGIGRGVALGVTAGLVIPTCECGVVLVVRRLMKKGVPAHVAIAYMLAAPIINPVVLASTYVAFQGSLSMLAGRVGIAVIVAGAVGLLAARMKNVLIEEDAPPEHHHEHDDCSGCEEAPSGWVNKSGLVLRHAAHEFIDMGKFFILGAIIAGLFKTFLPQSVLEAFIGNPVLQISGMMLLAMLLSVCSEADAFVAASFPAFSAAAKLAFVTIGPMIDLKLVGMFATTFNRRFFILLLIVPTVLVFFLTLIWEWLL